MPLPSLTNLIGRLLPDKAPRQTMYRKGVRKRLVEALQPLLVEQGFAPFKGNIAWRRAGPWIDVVEIEFFSTVTARADSPSLGIGRYFTFVPPDAISGPVKEEHGLPCPEAARCHLRKRLFHLKHPKDTTWIIGGEQEMVQCCAEAQQLLRGRAVPWFQWLDDLDTVLQLLCEGQADIEGKLRDPLARGTWNFGDYFGRHVIAGLVAFQLGQWAVCAELLAPVLEHGGTLGRNLAVLPLPLESLAAIRQAYDAAAARVRS